MHCQNVQIERQGADMGRIVVTEFISLDGVIEDPGGSEDFKYGGWSFEFDRGEEGDQLKVDETNTADAMLLGRKTYEGFAESWPSREGELAEKFNSLSKYVVSSTLEDPEWANSTVIGTDLSAEIARLKEELDGDIVVHGSAQLAQGLLEQGLFDETSDKRTLRLSDSKVVGDGVAILTYVPAA